MPTERGLEYINKIRASGLLENGQPSFLRGWEPVRFLGKGSYGFVYEIRRGQERCAVKIIDMGAHPDTDYSVEINALNMLRGQKHATNIFEYAFVSINHDGYIDRYLLIRMNLLRDLPASMSEDEVVDLGAQMCEILSVCHGGETKIYHCDVKPENMLVADDGTYILCDFGASSITQKSHKSSGHAGTPLFEAPEMLRFENFDGRSDLFSLGVTMYALLNNGLPPFAKNSNDAEAIRIRLEGKKPIPTIDGVSPELMKIIRKACAFDADRRYRSAGELGRELTALKKEREQKRRAEEEATRRAEEEARRKAEQERLKRQKADKEAEDSIYGRTSSPGENVPLPLVRKEKRKPFGIIATAAALVAAIVCGVIWLPGTVSNTDKTAQPVSGSITTGTDIKPEATGAEHFTFEETDGGYMLIKYDNSDNDVVIPSKYNGKPVVSIGNNAFMGYIKLLSVVIPDSVTRIGFQSFYGCSAMTSVNIPNRVTSIGDSAFYNCRSLTSITIPDSVTRIGNSVFYNCSSLTSVTIPDGVTRISDGTFSGCSSLTSVTIPDGVTSIGSNAFAYCSNLTSVTIPNSVTSIAIDAFLLCTCLTVTAPHKRMYYGPYFLEDDVNWVTK